MTDRLEIYTLRRWAPAWLAMRLAPTLHWRFVGSFFLWLLFKPTGMSVGVAEGTTMEVRMPNVFHVKPQEDNGRIS